MTQNIISFGSADAPQTLTAVLNLGCTDSRDWFNANIADLTQAADAGKLRVALQFWNKDKAPLQKGNQANGFIDYAQPEAAFAFIKAVFADQDPLNEAEDVAAYLTQTYGVHAQPDAKDTAAQTEADVAEHGITSLPTIIFEDRLYFDDSLQALPHFA